MDHSISLYSLCCTAWSSCLKFDTWNGSFNFLIQSVLYSAYNLILEIDHSFSLYSLCCTSLKIWYLKWIIHFPDTVCAVQRLKFYTWNDSELTVIEYTWCNFSMWVYLTDLESIWGSVRRNQCWIKC